jgi:CRISPR/Cas system Type II protein with McrA/HNH and RuvC-like nuclease domain
MKKLGEKILELRNQGKSYNEIVKILNCSKANVSYHCGKGQKEKTRERTKKRRKKTVISKRVENFQKDRRLRDKTEDFQRERIKIDGVGTRRGKRNITFRWHDVIEKYGWETTCYLTGRPINLKEIETYEFDHIIPYSKKWQLYYRKPWNSF